MVSVWLKEQCVLMDEHAHGNAGHVEAVEEVLDCHVRLVVHLVRLLQLQHSLRQIDEISQKLIFFKVGTQNNLSHCLNHIGVPRLHRLECLTKMQQSFAARFTPLICYQVSEALTVPVLKLEYF